MKVNPERETRELKLVSPKAQSLPLTASPIRSFGQLVVLWLISVVPASIWWIVISWFNFALKFSERVEATKSPRYQRKRHLCLHHLGTTQPSALQTIFMLCKGMSAALSQGFPQFHVVYDQHFHTVPGGLSDRTVDELDADSFCLFLKRAWNTDDHVDAFDEWDETVDGPRPKGTSRWDESNRLDTQHIHINPDLPIHTQPGRPQPADLSLKRPRQRTRFELDSVRRTLIFLIPTSLPAPLELTLRRIANTFHRPSLQMQGEKPVPTLKKARRTTT